MKVIYYIVPILLFISCQNERKTSPKTSSIDSIKTNTTKEKRIFESLVLRKRIHALELDTLEALDSYDIDIYSPKSVRYSADGSKFYVNSLEGYATIVYDSKTFQKKTTIKHHFDKSNSFLFKNNETTVFGYEYQQEREDYNKFLGKPVESCLSHNGKYLWVTFYRRSFDENASSPSAVAIIDTEKDKIVRVLPSGPLPKMIACSPKNDYIAVTHWGDNTVGIIDIKSTNVADFKYIAHIEIDKKLKMNFKEDEIVNRDNQCGNCLRGTVFSPDGDYLFIAKMAGNGIGVVATKNLNYCGTITGSFNNLRHIIINNNELILSSNKFGVVQKAPLEELLKLPFENEKTILNYTNWKTATVGFGARTIESTKDGAYIFACVNNESKIVVLNGATMEVIANVAVSKFPVGMAISEDGNQLIVTSQGKKSVLKSGNAVTIFEINYKKT